VKTTNEGDLARGRAARVQKEGSSDGDYLKDTEMDGRAI
jgi:hypothetical protein